MTTQVGDLVIDADAHVVKTEHTSDFMAPGGGAVRPKLVQDLTHAPALGNRKANPSTPPIA